MKALFKKISVAGPGLIGGSFARKCQAEGLTETITGFGRSEESLIRGVEMGILDSYSLSLEEAVSGSDLVLLAPPVDAVISVGKEMAPFLSPGAIVTDVGSVKAKIVEELDSAFDYGVNFIGGHPIAGTEKGGIESSIESLFDGAACILTPTLSTETSALNRVRDLWQLLGADVMMMDPEEHDRILGAVSHLPHAVAYALCNSVSGVNNENDSLMRIAAGGFKDITRVASSSPALWREITLMNRDNLLTLIDDFQSKLNTIRSSIERNDSSTLEAVFGEAKSFRDSI